MRLHVSVRLPISGTRRGPLSPPLGFKFERLLATKPQCNLAMLRRTLGYGEKDVQRQKQRRRQPDIRNHVAMHVLNIEIHDAIHVNSDSTRQLVVPLHCNAEQNVDTRLRFLNCVALSSFFKSVEGDPNCMSYFQVLRLIAPCKQTPHN